MQKEAVCVAGPYRLPVLRVRCQVIVEVVGAMEESCQKKFKKDLEKINMRLAVKASPEICLG